MTELSFFVPGVPQTQGGMRAVPLKGQPGRTAMVTTGSKDLRTWRRDVTQIATLTATRARWVTLVGPVEVTYRFLLPMASTSPAARKKAGIDWSVRKPDLDKLTRAVGDSLTDAGIYGDDGQVARCIVAKLVVHDRALCGAEVIVRPIPDDPATSSYLQTLLARRQQSVSRRQ